MGGDDHAALQPTCPDSWTQPQGASQQRVEAADATSPGLPTGGDGRVDEGVFEQRRPVAYP